MKKIEEYILEKFKINSKTAKKEYRECVFTDEELKDPATYLTCNIPEYDEEIDEWLENKPPVYSYHMGQIKKRKNREKNANWYQFYCYAFYNGPTKKQDIIKGIKGNTNSQYAEVFTEMKYYNILSSNRGVYKAEDPKNWRKS